MTRVILHGCNGAMGQVITGLCAEDKDITVVAGVDVYNVQSLNIIGNIKLTVFGKMPGILNIDGSESPAERDP